VLAREWLLSLIVRKLIWDAWNIEHIARRKISPLNIEWLLSNVNPRPRFQKSYSGTIAAWGKDESERYLLVVLASRDSGVYYPVTARPMTAREKNQFLRRSK
jgi:hypothetical protein